MRLEDLRIMLVTLVIICLGEGVNAGSIIFNGKPYDSQGSLIGPQINTSDPLVGSLFVAGYLPHGFASEKLGCNPYAVSGEFSGKIALIERGDCHFQDKIYFAQIAGAMGVVVFDSKANQSLTRMQSTSDPADVSIPSFFVSQHTGFLLISAFLNVYNSTASGLPVVITVLPHEYDPDPPPRGYTTLGIVFASVMGISALYWILFCLWRRAQALQRKEAMKKLKRLKYSTQPKSPQAAVADPSVGVVNDTRNMMVTVPMKSSSDSNQVDPNSLDLEGGKPNLNEIAPDTEEIAAEELAVESLNKSEIVNADTSTVISPTRSPNVGDATKPQRKRRFFLRSKRDGESNRQLFDSGACTVCLEEFENDDEIMVLPCRHIFHPDCVSEWLVSHGQCPMCKANVVTSNQRAGDEYPIEGLGRLFGYPVPQTIICWFVSLCLAVMLGYFLAGAGIIN